MRRSFTRCRLRSAVSVPAQLPHGRETMNTPTLTDSPLKSSVRGSVNSDARSFPEVHALPQVASPHCDHETPPPEKREEYAFGEQLPNNSIGHPSANPNCDSRRLGSCEPDAGWRTLRTR